MSSFEYSSLLGMEVAFLCRHRVFMRYLFAGKDSEFMLLLLQLTTLELEDMASLPPCLRLLMLNQLLKNKCMFITFYIWDKIGAFLERLLLVNSGTGVYSLHLHYKCHRCRFLLSCFLVVHLLYCHKNVSNGEIVCLSNI